MVSVLRGDRDANLTEDIRKIVKSIENSTELLRQEIAEAERRAELRRQDKRRSTRDGSSKTISGK